MLALLCQSQCPMEQKCMLLNLMRLWRRVALKQFWFDQFMALLLNQ